MSQILVVDDEVGIRELLSEILSDEGHQVRVAQNATEARQQRGRARPDLVLLDIWMPDTDGITLLKEWSASGQLTMPVVMMSGHGTIDTAVEATRIGAYGFLEKPIALQKLLATVGKALAQSAVPVAAVPERSIAFLGRAPIITDLKARLERVRDLRTPVMLLGEPGCGRHLCARYMHRANTPWIAPADTAFLDDPADKQIAQASDGSLFLRAVDALGRDAQRALLHHLPGIERCNARLVSTAGPLLPQRVAEGHFDSKLYSVLAAVTLRIPSLREHAEDIPEIANLLLARMAEAKEIPLKSFSTAALNQLRMYPWPGNLAQLETVVKSSALVAAGDEIVPSDVGTALSQDDFGSSSLSGLPLDMELREARDAFERAYFEYHIAREGGNMSRVAEKVGLERTHLYRKLKQLGVAPPRKSES
ncbi:MAG: sigma-54 dependent transcriptional regulator [Burkholderiales bacterium]|jgi:two-component system nitrogen regulation response regulator NtrX|nr:sigma-54 dependent transcriptional regulator [Burkholderiales bacterium]